MQEADQEEAEVVEAVIQEAQSTPVQALQKKAAVIQAVQARAVQADIVVQAVLAVQEKAALAIPDLVVATVAQRIPARVTQKRITTFRILIKHKHPKIITAPIKQSLIQNNKKFIILR